MKPQTNQKSPVTVRSGRGTKAPKRVVRDLAYVEVASTELTRDINRDLVLEHIRISQPISRVDLARRCGLQPSTVSSIVVQLKEEHWVKEGAAVKTARGRRPTMLSLNDDLLFLVADVRPTRAVIAVADINGHFLSRKLVPLGANVPSNVEAMANAMKQLRSEYPDKAFEGVGLSVPGRVDPVTNQLMLGPNLKWEQYDVAGHLEKALGLRVELENDANACLLSELWFGRVDGLRNVVLIAISEGVGSAILAEGRLISGYGGLAGEYGHICVHSDGPMCGCGKRGCWEVFASSVAAIRYYNELSDGNPPSSMNDLVGRALDGDKAALQALEMQSEQIGQGLRMVTASLAPEAILFAGDITTFWSIAHPVIERACYDGLLVKKMPQLLSIGDGELALLRGAAAVILQRHSGYYRSAHHQGRDEEHTAA